MAVYCILFYLREEAHKLKRYNIYLNSSYLVCRAWTLLLNTANGSHDLSAHTVCLN